MIEREICSIGDFLAARQADAEHFPGAIWYRGHADAKWQLMPGYIRSQRTVSETTLMARFRQSAAMLTERLPNSEFDWLFLMQHYGVPTRLLDWSESPLVALYFAVEPQIESAKVDGALWCLNPHKLNKQANIKSPDEEYYIPSFEDEEMAGYTPESVSRQRRLELSPAATIATRNNSRIQAQSGTFTVHHSLIIPIEDIGDRNHVVKYFIPSERKSYLFDELRSLGVNRFSLFPELASVGRILSESLS